jgi:hypothetical protein
MFDVERFLRCYFRTPAELASFVRAYGLEPPAAATVDKWFRRASIPGKWFPVLLAFIELDRGAPVSLAPFVVR